MNGLRLALTPWWLLQLGTGGKSFCDNPILGSPGLNRRGLHVARVRAADAMAGLRRRQLAGKLPETIRRVFDRDGVVELKDFLPKAEFERLRVATLSHRGEAREMAQGDTITRRIAIDAELMTAAPELGRVLNDPVWRGLTRYAGSHNAAPLCYIQTIFNGALDAAPDPQTAFHADTFHATVKAWLFLTDVAADEGALCYVPGSHRSTPERLSWERERSIQARGLDRLSARGSLRIEEHELARLGLPPPRRYAVPANTLIVADTHGFHARGPSVRPSTRIELWAYGRGQPFTPWAGIDAASLLGVADRRVGLLWSLRDRLEPLLGQPWRKVGRKHPDEPPA